MVHMYHIVLIHSSVDGHLGCFHFRNLNSQFAQILGFVVLGRY